MVKYYERVSVAATAPRLFWGLAMFRRFTRNLSLASGILLLFQIAAIHSVFAEKRVALVIGQSSYRGVVPLPNPANDAKKMTELLGSAGFDVTAAGDLTQAQMHQAVSNFADKVAASRAGHRRAGVLRRPWVAD